MEVKVALACFLFLVLGSCAREKSDLNFRAGEEMAASTNEVKLAQITDGAGCLNLAKYINAVKTLDPNLKVFEVTNDFSFPGAQPVRANLRKSLAYANYIYDTKPLAEIKTFPMITQDGCKELSLRRADGSDQTYKIIESSPTHLVAESDDSRQIRYHFLSEQRMMITERYVAYDMPCSDAELFVQTTKTLDWSNIERPAFVATAGSPYSIEHDYLNNVADAAGVDSATLYREENGELMLDSQRLSELAQIPLRSELLACN